MKLQPLQIFKILISSVFFLVNSIVFSQVNLDLNAQSYVDSLLKSGVDTIIEVKVKNELDEVKSVSIYYKNTTSKEIKYCVERFVSQDKPNKGKKINSLYCNNDWQTIFYLVSNQWEVMKNEVIIPDIVYGNDGSVTQSWPQKLKIYEIKYISQNNSETLIIVKDYFSPLNNNYKVNIRTTSYLLMVLVENYNNEIDKIND